MIIWKKKKIKNKIIKKIKEKQLKKKNQILPQFTKTEWKEVEN